MHLRVNVEVPSPLSGLDSRRFAWLSQKPQSRMICLQARKRLSGGRQIGPGIA
jgi:hypothetical protein